MPRRKGSTKVSPIKIGDSVDFRHPKYDTFGHWGKVGLVDVNYGVKVFNDWEFPSGRWIPWSKIIGYWPKWSKKISSEKKILFRIEDLDGPNREISADKKTIQVVKRKPLGT